ncbi:MAG: toxin-antitoxin system HicB family antitoxin [Armatimonadetes bacterium]|nr:toxin-antitoxin system HicB family antitoxin [Armatimonadota bacterium]
MDENVIDNWMARPYVVKLRRLLPAEGGGFVASIPQLGEWAYHGAGETPSEALAELGSIQRYLFGRMLEDGQEPPAAETEIEVQAEWPSGQLNLRIPRELHARLKAAAGASMVSLNTYLVSLLASGIGAESACSALTQRVIARLDEVESRLQASRTANEPTESRAAPPTAAIEEGGQVVPLPLAA